MFRVGGAWRFRREELNQWIAENIGKHGVRTHETTARGCGRLPALDRTHMVIGSVVLLLVVVVGLVGWKLSMRASLLFAGLSTLATLETGGS